MVLTFHTSQSQFLCYGLKKEKIVNSVEMKFWNHGFNISNFLCYVMDKKETKIVNSVEMQ